MTSPLLIITLGDPFSINMEGVAAILGATKKPPKTLIIGSFGQWQHQGMSQHKVKPLGRLDGIQSEPDGIYFFDCDQSPQTLTPETLSPEQRGAIAVSALEALRSFRYSGRLAVLTCPIEKKSAALAGFPYPGQTEFFADIWQSEALMILAGPKLRVALVTNHLPLSEVSAALSSALIAKKLRLFWDFLSTLLGRSPRIAVTGLNPHASDGGLFGPEDLGIIAPAIASVQADLSGISGPRPADTAFFEAYSGTFDGVLAMYHDQGLGPLKTVHFYDAVNISWGLKHLRVSPDHGPAQNLYGQGTASTASFLAAHEICLRYLEKKL